MNHNYKLSSEAAKARREYQKQWKLNNPERVQEHQKRYWEKVAQRANSTDSI